MNITNIPEGKHLTATEKKAIVAILKAGLFSGKVGNKVYRIVKSENNYSVRIESRRSNDFGKMIDVIYGCSFNVK